MAEPGGVSVTRGSPRRPYSRVLGTLPRKKDAKQQKYSLSPAHHGVCWAKRPGHARLSLQMLRLRRPCLAFEIALPDFWGKLIFPPIMSL